MIVPEALPDGTVWPRISIVIPWLDETPGRTLESSLAHRYPNAEVIAVRPSDRPAGRVDDRVAVVACEPGALVADAINTGLRAATGDLLTWLHGDALAEDALASIALALHTSGADVVVGAWQIREETGVRHHVPGVADGAMPLDALLDLKHPPPWGHAFFTRDVWERTGAALSTEWTRCWDHELWLRFAEAGARVHVVGRPLVIVDDDRDDDAYREELAVVVRACRDRVQCPAATHAATRAALRVVLLSDGFRGGSGTALRRIGEALAAAGHDVHALAGDDVRFATGGEIVDAVSGLDPDLVLAGMTNGALTPVMIDRIASEHTTALFMHDLWMLTGGCRHPGGCTRFISGCDQRCTCAASADADLSVEWASKRRVLSARHAPLLLAPSRWVLTQIEHAAARDSTMNASAARIRLGVDTDIFRPRDVATCRELLGLDPDAFIILTVASSLADERIGLVHLVDAVKLLGCPDMQVIAVGRGPAHRKPHLREVTLVDAVEDPVHLAMLYASADLFVGPRTAEAFGQVYIEAAACGTPGVGFPVDGVPEAILDGISGRLAETMSARALADGIAELHADSSLRASMARQGRLWVESEHSMAASAASIIAALRNAGFDVPHRIELQHDAARVPAPVRMTAASPFWSAREGFGGWEGPLTEVKPDGARWALGPVSRLSLEVGRGGPHVVALRVQNLLEGQRLRVQVNGDPAGEMSIPVTADDDEHLVTLDVDLGPGANRIELHTWCWDAAQGDRALLVVGVHAMRCGGA